MSAAPEGLGRMRPRHKGGLADGLKVCVIDMSELHLDMLNVFAEGLRVGIHIRALDGHRAYTDINGMVVVHERQARIDLLAKDLRELRTRATGARRLAVEETDIDVRAGYQSDSRSHTAKARQVEAELERLRVQSSPGVPRKFEGEVDFLLKGLSTLLSTADFRVPSEKAKALRSVLHDFKVELVDGRIVWSAGLMVPADGRVLVLGPFTGNVPAYGRERTPAEKQALHTSAGAGLRRRAVIHELMQAGYPKGLAKAASLAPAGFLPRVLLGEEVIWPQCPPGFDHKKFNAHVTSIWKAHPAWGESVYCQTSVRRQALADIVAALGGSATLKQLEPLLARVGMKRSDVYATTLSTTNPKSRVRPWPPSVNRVGIWGADSPASASKLASPICPQCGESATAVVRVPEVPDALLCRTCRIMPSDPGLEFPPFYLDLALPPTKIDGNPLLRARVGQTEAREGDG